MRIALISMAGEGQADLKVGGHSPAWHQLQAAIGLGCERIVCLADRPGAALIALQREAERRGASFHAIAHHRALSGLVRAADTLLVFAPGVLPDREWLARTIGVRAGVAVLPAQGAVEQGFERIDRHRAWAGVLATRGDAVEALGSLAPDADPVTGLLRVALQRGANAVQVPEEWLGEGRWALIATPAAADHYQIGWYARSLPAIPMHRPGDALAHRLARLLVARVQNAGRTATGMMAAGAVFALSAAAGGYLGYTIAGLVALAVASALFDTSASLGLLARAGTGERARRWPAEVRRALLDGALVLVAASPNVFEGWTAAFAALVLTAVIRLAGETDAPAVLQPLSDRTVVILLLTAAAAAGGFAPATALLAAAGLAVRIFWPRSARLTPV